MARAGVVSPAIWCRLIATAALVLAAGAYAEEKPADKPKEKPNRVERTAQKAGKFVEKTATRSGKFVEKTANRAGNFVDRTATKTGNAVKRAVE